jgi:hypothetical protein
MADGQFDKDFGYLMPFLDKIAAAGSNVSDPAAREELARLIAGEKSKWARIRQILSGGRAMAQPPTGAPAAAAGPQAAGEEKEVFAFTVGSLRPRR